MMVRDMVRETEFAADGHDDADLIQAIARRRDASALSELLNRHQNDAFALAYRIVGNRETAEDIVQEVMVRVWTTAASYRGDGPVRAWLLRIVARESINAIQKIKRTSARMENEKTMRRGDAADPQQQTEAAEITAALQKELERLPELDRQLIGLHIGGGLSQQEISSALSIPQQTISNHINRTLKALRSALATAGFSVTPVIMSGGIGDAFCSGIKSPAGLQQVALNKIQSMGREGSVRRSSQRSSSGRTVLVVAAAVVVGGALWVFLAQRPSTPTAPIIPITPSASTVQPPAFDWHKRWTFENGLPSDLPLLSGTYRWNKAEKTLECPEAVYFSTVHPMPAEPMLFTMKCKFLDVDKQFFFHQQLSVRNESKDLKEKRGWASNASLKTREFTRCLYIYKTFWVTTVNGELNSVVEIEQNAEGNIFEFGLQNLSVQEISATPLRMEDVPEFVRTPKFDSKP